MHSHRFTLLIFGMAIFHATKAQSQKDITQIIEGITHNVKVLLHDPALQEAAKAHPVTMKMLNESIDLTKNVLSSLIKASDAIFEASKCMRKVEIDAMDSLEGEIIKYLKCDLKVIQAIEVKTKQLTKVILKSAEDIYQQIKEIAEALINCPDNMNTLACAEKTIKKLWSILKIFFAMSPDVKPVLEAVENIAAGVRKCTAETYKVALAIHKKLMHGVIVCWKSHIHNRPPYKTLSLSKMVDKPVKKC